MEKSQTVGRLREATRPEAIPSGVLQSQHKAAFSIVSSVQASL
jgi:hypothetical protein